MADLRFNGTNVTVTRKAAQSELKMNVAISNINNQLDATITVY